MHSNPSHSLAEPGARNSRRPDSPKTSRRMVLQRRDMSLLSDVYAHGSMLRGQIQELHFGSVPRANARLRQLYDARFLQRATLTLPSAMDSAAGCQYAYLLGPAGIPVVAGELGLDPDDIRSQLRRGTPGYLLHTIEIVTFRLAVEAAARASEAVVLERFYPERLCRHAYEVREKPVTDAATEGRWRTEICKPDAVFVTAYGSVRSGFAVEIDLGHTSASEFTLKLGIHARYAGSGLFTDRYGAECAGTLIVTTSDNRRGHLAAIALKQPERIFRLATFGDIRRHGAFGPVWYSPGMADPHNLL